MAQDPHASLRQHLVELLIGGHAHAKFEDAIKGLPPKLRGAKPANFPHSSWMILEHLRIAQWDILEFSRNQKHESPKWPEGYWPRNRSPADRERMDKERGAIPVGSEGDAGTRQESKDGSVREDPVGRRADDFAGSPAGGGPQLLSRRPDRRRAPVTGSVEGVTAAWLSS